MAKSRSKRVLFTFDEPNLNTVDQMIDAGYFSSRSDLVRHAVPVLKKLVELMNQGFTEVVVTNPRTGAEKVLVLALPSMPEATVSEEEQEEEEENAEG